MSNNLAEQPKKTNKTINLLSDSHGRKLDEILYKQCGESIQIKSIVKPGGTIEHIMDEAQHVVRSVDNQVVIIAGANNLYNGQVDSLCRKHKNRIVSLQSCERSF